MESASKKGKIAIIGSGLIGKCWATLFARAGYDVVLYDIIFSESKTAEVVMEVVRGKLEEMAAKNLLREGQTSSQLLARITTTNNLSEALQGAFFSQECVPENVDLKTKVFKELDGLVGNDIILSSSSSCIGPSRFTAELKHKAQCIVSHPINPPHYIPLVEVVPSEYTDQSTIDRTIELMKELGQAPILVRKEVNGFIVNRLQYALIMEAWRLVEDGVASPEDVDTAMMNGLGLRYSFMGVFEVMHLNATGIRDYCQLYGDNITTVCDTQSPARPLTSGATLDRVTAAMESRVPLDRLEERRKWRDERLAGLALHKRDMERQLDK